MGAASQPCLDRYEVVDELGHGAMGTVYLAQDPLIGRLVAIKTFHSTEVLDAEQLAELRTLSLHEARTAGILSHPNIVAIHDIVQTHEGHLPLIAMEYVRGTNLLELLKSRASLPFDFVRRVARQIASALDYAHSMGVVHGDVKPANILITEDEQAKLTDFGIASLDGADLTRGKRLLGTPSYVAPERILGRRMDHRADIFSLGVVLFEMLFGRTAFPGESAAEIVHAIAHEPFEMPADPPNGLGPDLECLLARALHKNPDERYQRASELADDLDLVCLPPVAGGDPAATQDLLEILQTQEVAEEPSPGLLATPEPPAAAPAGTKIVAAPAKPDGSGVASEAPEPPTMPSASPPPRPARVTWSETAAATPSRQRTSLRRLAIATLLVCVAALPVAAWVLTQRAGGAPLEQDEARRRYQVFELLQSGRAQLQAGRPGEAAATLRLLEDLDPELEIAARLRLLADERIVRHRRQLEREERLAGLLAEARESLAQSRLAAAHGSARAALDLAPDDAEARDLARRAANGLRLATAATKAERVSEEQAPAIASVPEPSPEAPPSQEPAVPAPAGQATLRIDLFSHAPRGVLTVYAGDQQVLLRPFRFVRKAGFLRRKGTAGRLETEVRLEAGETMLRIMVSLPGRETEVIALPARLPGGGIELLRVSVSETGAARAELAG